MRVPVPDPVPSVDALGRVHLVGIGGAGLSGIARLLLARDVQVSGSDAVDSAALRALRVLGARCHVGHAAEQVADADTVVVSTAVRADNPEVIEAGRLGLRLLPRSAALESLMQDRTVVAVAGTHGKTTTTALLVAALAAAGVDPSYAVGGELADTGTNAHLGGELFVAEADESDGAFLVYSPLAAVVTGVDADHLDVWGTTAAYRAAFVGFLDRIAAGGFLVVNTDDPGGADLAAEAAGRRVEVVSVGSGDGPAAGSALWLGETVADGAGSHTPTRWRDQDPAVLRLQVPGRHYAVDAALALAVGLRLDLDADRLLAGLASYTGTRRRMELRGEVGGVAVYDSYAHHPVEIAGDLEAARSIAGAGRVLVCFQPHLVSRTRVFGTQMGEALGAADEVVVLDVYVAREIPEPGIDGALVAGAVPLPADRVHYAPDPAPVPTRLAELARPGDLVLTLGAGDVTELAPKVLDELRNRLGGSLDRA